MTDPVDSVSPPRVFISYSHDSDEHRTRVLALSQRLRDEGIDAWLDRFVIAPPEGWPKWMEDQLEQADFVLLIFSEVYRRRWEGDEEPGKGLGVAWEAHLARQALYASATSNAKFVPILFDGAAEERIPLALQAYTRHRLPDEYEKLYRHLTSQPDVVPAPLGQTKTLEPTATLPLPSKVVRSAGMFEAEVERLFDEGVELEEKARQNGDVELVLESARRLHEVAAIMDQVLMDVGEELNDVLTSTRRAQRDYFRAQELNNLSWYYYEKRELDEAEAAANQSADLLVTSLGHLERAIGQAPGNLELQRKATRWSVHQLELEMMLVSIGARRAWRASDMMTAMDCHRRAAQIAGEAKRFAEEKKLEPSVARILAGNAFTMQANAAQSAAKIFESRGLEGDERSQIECFRLQLEAHGLWREALRANPEWRQPEAAMNLIEGNLRRFIDANRSHWRDLYVTFRGESLFLSIMREVDPARFSQLERG